MTTAVSGTPRPRRTRRRRPANLATALAAAMFALAPLSAVASIGTGIGANPIVLTETAQPGHSYVLPQLYVVNTGTETSRYGVRVQRLEKGAQHDVPSGWVALPNSPITLAAGLSTRVPLRLVVPAGAASGAYMTNLVAGTVAPGGTVGTSLGAAAATQLRFSVGSVDAGFSWPLPVWADALLSAGALSACVVVLARRAGMRVHVELRR